MLRMCGGCTILFWALVATYIFVNRLGRGNLRAVQPSDSILITGARSGIGRHAALTMNHLGFTVFAGVRKEKDGVILREQATHPDKFIPVTLDVTKEEQIAAAVKLVADYVGSNGLTAIFHNAGVVPSLPEKGPKHTKSLSVEVTPMETFRWVMEVEYFGTIAVTKAFLGLLEKSAATGRPARIVFNSDAKISVPYIGQVFGSLFAMDAVATAMRRELMEKGTGVDIIVMQPGAINTKSLTSVLDTAISAEFSDLYSMEKAHAESFMEEAVKTGVSPQATSDDLVDAVLSLKPYTRYYPGFLAYAGFVVGHFFPDEWTDAFFAYNVRTREGKLSDPAWVEKARKMFSEEPLPIGMKRKSEL